MENFLKNPNTLIHAVKVVANTELTARPFNYFEPDNTTWWLIPTTEWPAYKYGKIFFKHTRIADQEGVYVGFNVEKGLKMGDFYHPSLIMKHDWLWDEFINSSPEDWPHLPEGQILTIKASFIPPEKANHSESPESVLAQKENFANSSASFEIKSDLSLNLIGQDINPTNRKLAEYFQQDILKTNDLSDLISKIKNISESDWVWIDFYLGLICPENSSTLTPTNLWKQYLEPWTPWLRKSHD